MRELESVELSLPCIYVLVYTLLVTMHAAKAVLDLQSTPRVLEIHSCSRHYRQSSLSGIEIQSES